MKIIIADLRVTGNEHLMINSAIVEGFLSNSVESIEFHAEQGHLMALTKLLPSTMNAVKQCSFRRHHYPSRIKTLFFREILLPFKLARVFYRARKSDLLLISTITPFGHVILSVMAPLLGKKVPCITIMHSELEVMEGEKISLSSIAMKVWQRLNSRHIKYVVLSPHISESLPQRIKAKKNIFGIFHPFPRNLIGIKPEASGAPDEKLKIRIGVPGLIRNDKKGSGNIFKLEKLLAASGRHDIELHLIGRALNDFKPPANTNVYMPFLGRSTPVPQREFDDALLGMDLILLMYDKDNYRLTASGAVLDPLKFGCPLYAVRNPLFNYMETEGIFPGHLSDTVETLFDEISEGLTVEKLDEAKRNFQSFFSGLAKRTDPHETASVLLKLANGEIDGGDN